MLTVACGGSPQVMMPLTHEFILRYYGSFHHQARPAPPRARGLRVPDPREYPIRIVGTGALRGRECADARVLLLLPGA